MSLTNNETELKNYGNDVKVEDGDIKSDDEKSSKENYNYEDVLELIGFGRAQVLLVLTGGLLLMAVINETSGMGITALASQCDFDINSTQKGFISSASVFGIIISSYFWGYVSDIIGRRLVLCYSTLVAVIFSFGSVFIPWFWLFILFRVLVGCFLAGASSTVYAYLGEFLITKHRPLALNVASSFVGISNVYTPAVGWLVLTMNWSLAISDTFSFRPWRLLIVLNFLPGLLGVFMLMMLPESPKILLSKNKNKEAMEAIDWIAKQNTGTSLSDLKVFKVTLEEENSQILPYNNLRNTKSSMDIIKEMWYDTIPLFKRPHVVNFLLCCIVLFGMFLSSVGVGVWYPGIQNHDSNIPQTVCQVISASKQSNTYNYTTPAICNDTISSKTFIDTITLGAIYVLGFIILCFIIGPLGRKSLIVSSLALSGTFGLLLFWISQPFLLLSSFVLFLALPGVFISVLGGSVVDLVPTHLRGKAVCIFFMIGRCGGVVGIQLLGGLLESYCIETFATISVFMWVCAILSFIIPL